jgi:hypothetical protein
MPYTALTPDMPDVLPCASCGKIPMAIESSRPEGRTKDIFRVTCDCGCASLSMWSVSKGAAVRHWNYYMTDVVGEKSNDLPQADADMRRTTSASISKSEKP